MDQPNIESSSPGALDCLLESVTSSDLKAAAFCAALNSALFLVVLMITHCGFESGDDPAMMQMASGTTLSEPTDHLVFSNVLIGRVLCRLYQFEPTSNWYANYLLAAHFLAMSALLWGFLRLHPSMTTICAYLLLFALFETRMLLELQFTSAAMLAGCAGFLLMLTSLVEETRRSALAILWSVFLVTLSAMIRVHAFYFAMMITFPLIAISLWQRLPPISLIRRYSLRSWPLIVAILAAFSLVGYDHWTYARDPQWKSFREYQTLRATLYDYSVLEDVPNARFFFERVGWSHNDFNMFQHYYLANDELSNRETLTSLLTRFGRVGRSSFEAREHRRAYLDEFFPYFALTFLHVALAAIVGKGARLRCLLFAGIGCGLLVAVFYYFSIYAKLAPRIITPSLFVLNAAVLISGFLLPKCTAPSAVQLQFAARYNPPGVKLAQAVGSLLLVVGYGLVTFQISRIHYDLDRNNSSQQLAFEHLVDQIAAETTVGSHTPLFVVWGSEYPKNWAAPNSQGVATLAKLPTIGLGWNTQSPYYQAQLARCNINNIYQALYEQPEVHCFASRFDVDNMVNYVLEHHSRMIEGTPPRYYLYEAELTTLPLLLQTLQFLPLEDSEVPEPAGQ